MSPLLETFLSKLCIRRRAWNICVDSKGAEATLTEQLLIELLTRVCYADFCTCPTEKLAE